MTSRRLFLRRVILGSPFGIAGSMGFAHYLERHAVEVVAVERSIGLGRPLTAALLGDIHFDPFHEVEYIERVGRLIQCLSPDLVLYTGDFFSGSAKRIGDLLEVLTRVTGKLGRFAVLGNHEFWVNHEYIAAQLDAAGIRVLRNETVPIPGYDSWFLTGMDSFWAGKPNSRSLMATPATARHIVMAHEPDSFDRLTDPRIVLQVSGHTHGGQIRVPFGGGAILLPSLGQKYVQGWFERNGQYLYVNRGIGTVGQHYRLNCRPEITYLKLS